MVLELVLLGIALLILYGFHPITRWRFRHIAGPRPAWLVGNLAEMLSKGQVEAAARWGQLYGPIWCFWLGAVPVVMTDDPHIARKIVVRPVRHKIYSLHVGDEERFESNNIVFINHAMWKETRNAWQPFFSPSAVLKNDELMARSAAKLVRHLAPAAQQGQPVDVWRELGLMTMDVVGTAAFGVDFNTLEKGKAAGGQQQLGSVHTPADRLVGCVNDFFELFGLGNPLFALFFLFPECERWVKWLANAWPTPNFKREIAARRQLRIVGTELVQQAHAAMPATGDHNDGGSKGGSGGSSSAAHNGTGAASRQRGEARPGSFLSLVLPFIGRPVGDTGTRLDELWAATQASGFILAGYETTANALAFTMYCLALNPDKEAKLLAELDAWGPPNRLPSAADMDSFPYATACFQESLRLYPPAAAAVRESPAGGMQLGGLNVPEGTALQVSIFAMHRNPKYWSNPEAYIPERFVEGSPEAAEVTPGAFMPFGDGARKCIGYRFATLEGVLTLVTLYQQYTFKLLPGQQPLKLKTSLTTGPANGIKVTVHPRRQGYSTAEVAEE
ncbi:hypothetical protein COHA_008846 [Chlorella ohadii]|uniref:Cytochrome P450 n=1 Tax=Chlorella ohadii TaxID=2649997 RepID=A0AAD5DJJ6_9CHLO|nr:hypothetical protein COHA_008846 [Chlorella ohadii]